MSFYIRENKTKAFNLNKFRNYYFIYLYWLPCHCGHFGLLWSPLEVAKVETGIRLRC